MAFNSIEFFIFFSVTYLLYRMLPRRGQNILLLVASYLFYGWLDWRLVILLLISTAIAFHCGVKLDAAPLANSGRSQPQRQRWLWLGIGMNLAILGFFKYFNFFIASVESFIHALGSRVELFHLKLILIAGISFYTFKAISYLVDVYRQKITASHNILDFALFLAFFPSLLAGPIDRAAPLLTQLSTPRCLSFDQSAQGGFLILLGLFKKVAIADGVAASVDGVYRMAGTVSWLDVVLATLLYAIQIYCDFSGYSDIAIGLSKLFGIELMANFNQPYFSKNPSEFWQRWHISLSTWLRDYLYIPLGGNRQGDRATYRNLMATMVLGGLWHGAAWNYVLWGAYQGAVLCLYRSVGSRQPSPLATAAKPNPWRNLALILVFLGVTCYGWLLFRSTSLAQVIQFTQILTTDFGNFELSMPKLQLSASWGIPVLIGYELFTYSQSAKLPVGAGGRVQPSQDNRIPIPARAALCAILLFILIMGQSNAPAQYIYTQF